MVDVGDKRPTRRVACAEAWVRLDARTLALVRDRGSVAKGNVLDTARLAGIMAAKRTAELIPLCHGLAVDVVDVDFDLEDRRVHLVSRVACHGRTGAEMEALTAVSVAALTIYDMCKSADKGIEIERVRLVSKAGGKSGAWRRPQEDARGTR
jgi:cyclic pyranopterin phosphate synthase